MRIDSPEYHALASMRARGLTEIGIPRYRCALVREMDTPYHADPYTAVTNADRMTNLLTGFFAEALEERLVVVLLDAKLNVIGISEVSRGVLNQAIGTPREVFRAAILANAGSIVLAHNHPSGAVMPSRADSALTAQMKAAGDVLGIKLLDHIIVGFSPEPHHYSFAEAGTL
jgi:DNA repair protein RadC